jgi:hypothetical protein
MGRLGIIQLRMRPDPPRYWRVLYEDRPTLYRSLVRASLAITRSNMVTLGVLGRSGRLANARQQVKSWPRGLACRRVRTSEFSPRSLRSTTAVPLALLRSDLMSRRVQLLRRDAESGRRQSEVAAGGAGGRWGRAWRGRCCGSRRRQRRTRCGGKTRSSTSLPCASRWPSSAFAIGILMPIMMVSMHSGFVVTPSATRHDGRLESECWVHSWQFLVSIQIPARPPLQL